jgi:hypothetical protein
MNLPHVKDLRASFPPGGVKAQGVLSLQLLNGK